MNDAEVLKRREKLLEAWIDMSMAVRGNRLVSAFSFNEIVICRILYRRQQENGEPVTASELCQKMHLLKSQINRLLTSMEKAGFIERVRSQSDRRKVEIVLTPAAVAAYEAEHARVMHITGHVSEELGEKQTEMLTELINQMVVSIRRLERGQIDER